MSFGAFAQGLSDQITEHRQLQARKQEADAAREHATFLHLIQSDDPDLAAAALVGLTQQNTSKPGKGFFAKLYGETEKNPMMPTIRQLMAKGKQVPNAGAPTPDAPPQGEVPAGIAEDRAALPAGSPVEPQGPRMSAATAPPGPVQFHEGPSVGTHTVPRQAFLSAGEKAGAIESAKLGAHYKTQIEAYRDAAAMGPGAVHALFPGSQNAATTMGGYITGPNGQRYQRRIGRDGTEQFFPVDDPVAQQVKPRYETLADPTDGRPHAYRIMPNGTRTDLGAKPVRDGYITAIDPDTGEQYSLPAPAVFERPRATGGAVTPPPAAPAGSPLPAGGVPPSGAGSTTASGQPAGPSAGPARTAPPAGGQGRINQGRRKNLKETEGAIYGPDGTPQMATAQYDAATGAYTDPTTGQPFSGFIPGDMGHAAVQIFASTKATIDKIDNAIDAIKKTGFADSVDPKDTLTLWRMYRNGANPALDAFGSLTSLASLAGASQYVKSNSRSMAMYNKAAEHTAKLPTDAQAVWGTTLGVARLVTPDNAMRIGGTPWDSPAALIEKLKTSRQASVDALQEQRTSLGKTQDRQVGGPPGAGTIRMRAPNGQEMDVAPDQVDHYTRMGAVVVVP